ncbi:hypothetical protein AOLI_G00100670 [Acnodon oligacanthus]
MAASTASNSNRSSPACSPVLRKRCRSPTVQSLEGENMVEKGSEQSDTSKSPSTPEQLVTRTYSVQSTRSSSKNSKSVRMASCNQSPMESDPLIQLHTDLQTVSQSYLTSIITQSL